MTVETRNCIIRSISEKKLLGPLDHSGWLADQSDSFKTWAIRVARVRHFAEGEYIYRAGDSADGLHGLRSGSVDIEFPLLGEEPVSITRENEGFWIGDLALLSQTPRLVSVRSAEDTSIVHIPDAAIRQHLAREPRSWQCFYELNCRNMQLALTLLAESLSLTVRARVCRILLSLSQNRKEVKITQDTLAKTLGIARPTLQRCIADLTALGAIESKYRRIAILDRDTLVKLKDEQ